MKQTEKFRLVLADDDPDDCEIFRAALEKVSANFSLETFHNGKTLLEHLEKIEEMPHLVFLDLNMPLMNGLEALKEIRRNKRTSNLSVAIYSTSTNEKDIEETLANGANVYIAKPSNFTKLQELLERILETNWQFHTARLNRDNYFISM